MNNMNKKIQEYQEMIDDLDRKSKEVMMDIRNQIKMSINELEEEAALK